jgi:type III secretory pathway component EscT
VFTYASAQRIFCCAVAALLLCVTRAISLFAFAGFSKDGLLEDGGVFLSMSTSTGLQCTPLVLSESDIRGYFFSAFKMKSARSAAPIFGRIETS